MAKKCWLVTYTNCVGASGSAYLCSENIVYIPTGGSCGGGYFTSPDLGFNYGNASEQSGSAVQVSCAFCPGCCTDALKYDCINGQCKESTQYNTPGIYQSLADCQAVCANGGACAEGKQCVDPTNFCPPGKICIDQGEFSSIEALISKIGSEVC